MRPIATIRPGNWLWDINNERYITVVEATDPVKVQSLLDIFCLKPDDISHLRISDFTETEMGFVDSEKGWVRISKVGQTIQLIEAEEGYIVRSPQSETDCIWLIDQLQNGYKDLTGEELEIGLVGSKMK